MNLTENEIKKLVEEFVKTKLGFEENQVIKNFERVTKSVLVDNPQEFADYLRQNPDVIVKDFTSIIVRGKLQYSIIKEHLYTTEELVDYLTTCLVRIIK